jgi:hypothetical protein
MYLFSEVRTILFKKFLASAALLKYKLLDVASARILNSLTTLASCAISSLFSLSHSTSPSPGSPSREQQVYNERINELMLSPLLLLLRSLLRPLLQLL